MEFIFDNNIPIYIQLLDYMKIYLISGVFKCGEKLPSVREFATTFNVNPNTMQKALAELEDMDLIYTERTNGKYVTKDEKLIEKVKEFIDGCTDEPFFLYYGLHQPHVPRVPHPRFAGLSGMGPRGDVILEADWCVGEVLSFLRNKGLLENTLVIFTSDNGAVLNDGYKDGAVELLGGHDPMNGMRGGKYSLYDGGTHVPFIVAWHDNVRPGLSDAFISQIDLFPTLAELVGAEVPGGLDGQPMEDVLVGKSKDGRKDMIIEAQGRLAYKYGDHVLIPPYSGNRTNETGNELGNLPDWALFNLAEDPAQNNNIAYGDTMLLNHLKIMFEKTKHQSEKYE